jgi:hypothetical protein
VYIYTTERYNDVRRRRRRIIRGNCHNYRNKTERGKKFVYIKTEKISHKEMMTQIKVMNFVLIERIF